MNANDPFGRTRFPPTFSREGRIRLVAQYADDVLAGRPPSREAETFLAGAIRAYLAGGGDLARDYLKLSPPKGSRLTPAAILRRAPHPDEGEDCENRS